MADQLFVNNVRTTLAADIDDSQTTLQVASATGFPAPTGDEYFLIAIYDQLGGDLKEIVKCTDVSSVTCTIERGQEGTSGTACDSGDVLIISPPTKGTFETLQDAIEANETDIAANAADIAALGSCADVNYTISTDEPSGGSDGDVWYQVDS